MAEPAPAKKTPVPGNKIAPRRAQKQEDLRDKKKAQKELLPGSAEAEAALDRKGRREDAAAAARLAQVVNLHIGGYSLTQIGAAIGATADEVDQMLARDAARYVRSQPALRTYVRNWISERYMKMIDADWNEATDRNHPHKLEHQDRVDRFLRSMARLHGAEAPTQAEVKVEAAPETVEKMVAQLAAAQGVGYDMDIFDGGAGGDVVDAEIIEDSPESVDTAPVDTAPVDTAPVDTAPVDTAAAVTEAERVTEVSGNLSDEPQEGEPEDGF